MSQSAAGPRVVQAGVGRWGANHLRVWLGMQAKLFVAEPAAAGREACRKAGVPDDHIVRSVADVLDAVDLVDVVTPVDSHFEIARLAIEAGKDVFIEKPLASTSEEASALVRLARERGRILQVGHIFRYDPATDFIRDAIARGELGQIRWLQGRFAGFKRPRADCGVTAADALHFIDLFNFLMGRSPDAVLACMADVLGRGMDDLSWVGLDYDGAIGMVEANYFAPDKARSVTIVGEAATVLCDYASGQDRIKIFGNRHVSEGGTWKAVEGTVTHQEVNIEEPLARELRAFIRSSLTRETPLADGHCGAEVVRIIEAAQFSSETGHAVSLLPRSTDANRTTVESLHLRRDQAEGLRGHRFGAVHSRAAMRRV